MIVLAFLSACALVIAGYMLGAMMARKSIADIFDVRHHCPECPRHMGRPISVWRCECGEELHGPAIADEIRDDYFFERPTRP